MARKKNEMARVEQVIPKACVCGRKPIVVKKRGETMYFCPDPCRCPGNMRSPWARNADEAAVSWNNNIRAYRKKVGG